MPCSSGVPDSSPVVVSIVIPGGKPVALTVGRGKPPTVGVSDSGMPRMKVILLGTDSVGGVVIMTVASNSTGSPTPLLAARVMG